jgi:hypothetical protein
MLVTLESMQQELADLFKPQHETNVTTLITRAPKCVNMPRMVVENWDVELDPTKWAWISIQEPDQKSREGKLCHYPHTKNEILDKLPNLKLKFHDLTKPITHWHNDMWLPPSERDAYQIVKFCLEHKGKNIIANCAAGVSRSGAICQFLEEELGYDWGDNKQYSCPNRLLVQMLKNEFHKIS